MERVSEMIHIDQSGLKDAVASLKKARLLLIQQLNDTEERIAALNLVEKLLATGRASAISYAKEIMTRLE